MNGLLNVGNMHAWYGSSQALFGVDLDVGEGEVVALMGRNGMGKTTAIQTVLGLIRPCTGEIRFSGTRHNEPAASSHRKAGNRIGARGQTLFSQSDGSGESSFCLPAGRVDPGKDMRTVSVSHGTPGPAGGHSFGGRTTDAGHWAGTDDQSKDVDHG